MVVVEEEPQEEEVVDLAWLRANLSSLWQEFRALSRLQVMTPYHYTGRLRFFLLVLHIVTPGS